MIIPYITSQVETVSRVHVVWDKYLTNSLKQSIIECTVVRRDNAWLHERLFRRTGRRIIANKDELVHYMSECVQPGETGRKVTISTIDETIVSTQNRVRDVEYIQPCSHEEEDIRAFCSTLRIVHGKDFANW